MGPMSLVFEHEISQMKTYYRVIVIQVFFWGCGQLLLSDTQNELFNVPMHTIIESAVAATIPPEFVVLENRMAGTVSIDLAHSSCPCLTFDLPRRTLAPGESIGLSFKMNLASMVGRVERFIFLAMEPNERSKKELASPDSIIRKTVTCSSGAKKNEPVTIPITESTRSIILTVFGEANPSASLKPISANFGTVTSSKLNFVPRRTTLCGTNTNAQIVSISSAPTPFVVTADANKKGFFVALARDARPGRYIGQLTVRTTDPEVPEMPFYLYAHILGEIEVLPNAIEISRSQPTSSAVVLLRPTAKKTFRVLSARTVPDLGTLRIQSLPDGSWRVLLSDIPTADVLPRSFLLLETDLPDCKEIKLPFVVANPKELKL